MRCSSEQQDRCSGPDRPRGRPRPGIAGKGSLLLLAVLEPGCGSASLGEGPARPPGAISVSLLEDRATLLRLVESRYFEPWIAERLARRPSPHRRELALALGRIGDPAARLQLEGLLLDTVPAVRQAAAWALGALGDPAARPALLRAASDPDPGTGREAVASVARLGGSLAMAEDALPAGAEGWRRLAPSLHRFTGSQAVARARLLLDAADPEVARGALTALAAAPEAGDGPRLQAFLDHPDPRFRALAARGLGATDGGDPAALTAALEDPDAGVRIAALQAVSRLLPGTGDSGVNGLRALLRALDDPAAGVRLAALEAAGVIPLDERLAEELLRRSATGASAEAAAAALVLARARDPRAAGPLARLAGAEDPFLRARAAEMAVLLGDTARLRDLAADDDAGVRAAAVAAAVDASGSAGAAWAEQRGLDDAHPAVRVAALTGLARRPGVAVEHLLASARSLPEESVGRAAVAAIGARAGAVPAERAVALAALQELAGRPGLRGAATVELAGLDLEVRERRLPASRRPVQVYQQIAWSSREPADYVLESSRGSLRIRLDCPQVPLHCANFRRLADQGYYDGLRIHRVQPGRRVETGDPTASGWGGPGYTLPGEPGPVEFGAGTVGVDASGPDGGSGQFFISLAADPALRGRSTRLGQVVDGLEVARAWLPGDRVLHLRSATRGVGERSSR